MSLVDKILNGDFDDDEDISIAASQIPSKCEGEELQDQDVEDQDESNEDDCPEGDWDPADETDEEDEEELAEGEDEDDYDDSDEDDTPVDNSDVPSEAWMREYMLENGIPNEEPELATAASTQYVEKPKQSKVRTIKSMNTTPENTPKQSTTKVDTADAKKRGAPYKLSEHAEEVCRLYNEGVGAKVIAEKFTVSVSCVINTLKRNNITIRPKGRRKASN